MLSIPAYAALAALLLVAASRTVRPIPGRSAALLALMPLLFVGGAMLRDTAYAPADIGWNVEPLAAVRAEHGVESAAPGIYSDVTSQIAPWRHAVYRAWRAGEWPLWNPSLLCGDLLAGTAQPAPFYPLLLLTLWAPFPIFLTLQTALAFLVAALGAWLFFADLELGELPALLGAAGWAFSSFVAFWIHWPMGVAVVWLPLVLLGGRRVVRVPGARSTMLLAVTLACPLLAGHPETGVHLVFFGALWAAIEWLVARPARPFAALASGFAGGALALGLAAVALLPILEALPQTFEHGWRVASSAWRVRSVPWPDAATHLVASAVPFAFGVPGEAEPPVPFDWRMPGTAYVGSVLLPLALLGLGYRRDRRGERRRIAFAAFAVLGLLAGVQAPGISEAIAKVPLFDISLNERLVFVGGFGIVALAALGLERFLARPGRGLGLLALGVAAGLALLGVPLARALVASGFSVRGAATRAAILVLAPALLGLAALLSRQAARVAAVALLVLLAQRRVEAGGLFPLHSAAAFYPKVPPLDRLVEEVAPYRVVGHGYAMLPATATHYGLEDPRGYQALTFRRLLELEPCWSVPMPVWFNRVDDLAKPMLDLLNVRYALTSSAHRGAPGWELVAEGSGSRLFRNTEALERAFVPARVRYTPNGARTVLEMAATSDFSALGWIEDPRRPPSFEPVEEVNGPGRVTIRARGAGYRLDAEMERAGWAVVTVAAWRGWRARSAAGELPLAFGDHAFLAVELPAGRSRVDLDYLPTGFVVGGAATLGTIALMLAGALWLRRRGAGHSPEPGDPQWQASASTSCTGSAGEPSALR